MCVRVVCVGRGIKLRNTGDRVQNRAQAKNTREEVADPGAEHRDEGAGVAPGDMRDMHAMGWAREHRTGQSMRGGARTNQHPVRMANTTERWSERTNQHPGTQAAPRCAWPTRLSVPHRGRRAAQV